MLFFLQQMDSAQQHEQITDVSPWSSGELAFSLVNACMHNENKYFTAAVKYYVPFVC